MVSGVDIVTARSIMNMVKAAILVVGMENVPGVPKGEDELRTWYIKVCVQLMQFLHYLTLLCNSTLLLQCLRCTHWSLT